MRPAQLYLISVLTAACAAWAADNAEPRPAGRTEPQGATPWDQKYFVNPPLKCIEPYRRINSFPVMAWCFHGQKVKGYAPYDEEYATNAKAAGFNVLVDDEKMLEPCRKAGGIQVVVPTFRHSPDRLRERVFKPLGDPASLMGFMLDDNRAGVMQDVVATAAWMKTDYPHLAPFVSQNPAPQEQSKTDLRIFGTHNYAFMQTGGRRARQAYCQRLDFDRGCCNAWSMAQWPVFGGTNTPSEYRFQVMAALAYGAQGVIYFAYTPHRGQLWRPPGNDYIKMACDVNTYARKVLGRHVWGTRCTGVFHTDSGSDVPASALPPGVDQFVRNMDEALLAGILVVENRFDPDPLKRVVPDYVMVVDKRTGRIQEPSERATWIALAPEIPVVEILDRDAAGHGAIRKIGPGRLVLLKLNAGDGVLLLANPKGLDKVLGSEQAASLYAGLAATLAALPQDAKAAPPDAVKQADQLKGMLNEAVKAGKVAKPQADAVMQHLTATINAIAALAAKPAAKPQ